MEIEARTKNKFWKGVLVGVLVTAFAGLIIVGAAAGILLVGRAVIDDNMQQIVAKSEQKSENNTQLIDYRKIQKKLMVLEQIVDKYFLFDENKEDVEAGIYKGMLAGLDDPYTVYYTPKEYQTLTETTTGTYCGIGALVTQNVETGVVMVLRVFHDSPAEKAGVKKGDIIYKVDGMEASNEDLDILVQQRIRGEEGTSVKMILLRSGEELEKTMVRSQVEVDTVEYQMLSDGETGYVLVTQFDVVTPDQFQDAIENLQKQGMRQLIVDLRDNPGGVLDAAVEMLAYLLPESPWDGTIISTADKYGKGVRYYCKGGEICFESNDGSGKDPRYPMKDGHELNVPIVVLMNGDSASASEVFAGTLRDYQWAKLVGTTSFGKGIVQSLVPLGDGSAVKITTAHYYTPSGYDLHGKGLKPDVEIEFHLPEDYDITKAEEYSIEDDNQLQKALEILMEEKAG